MNTGARIAHLAEAEEIKTWRNGAVGPLLAAGVEEVVVALAEYGVERPGCRMRDGEIEVREREMRRSRRIRRRVSDRKAQYVLGGIVPIEMKRLKLNPEFFYRHLAVCLLMFGMSCWFGYDGLVACPNTPAAELYEKIEKSKPPEGF